MINSNHFKSPSRTIYSDRFIPSRSGSNFALFGISSPAKSPIDGREDSSNAYTALLRKALFGPDAAGIVSPATPDKRGFSMTPTSRNIFRYKTETRLSMHSLEPFMLDDDDDVVSWSNHSPVKTPRKVPRSPYKVIRFFYFLYFSVTIGIWSFGVYGDCDVFYKVLDAPALQDDFYLNLVDWSSHNVLAVGLGTCVYLWNACSSKVSSTKYRFFSFFYYFP